MLCACRFCHRDLLCCRTLGEWGGHPELYAAAQCLEVNIYIYRSDNSLEPHTIDAKKFKTIRLSYHGECHYNSVRIKGELEGPALFNANKSNFMIASNVKMRSGEPAKCGHFADSVSSVLRGVPWVSRQAAEIALDMSDADIDDAIEILISNPNFKDIK